MIVSHRYRFIFIKTRKTAGTSIEWYLNRLLGPDDVATPVLPPLPDYVARNNEGFFNPVGEIRAGGVSAMPRAGIDVITRRRYYNHLPAYRLMERIGRDLWNSYFTFCVERNPWDKTISYFQMIRARSRRSVEWDSFLAGAEHCHNLPLYTNPQDRSEIMVNKVLRYERLDAELSEVFERLDVPFSGSLRERAKSEYRSDNRHYSEWYDEKQQRRVSQLFAEEIQLHGYTFERT